MYDKWMSEYNTKVYMLNQVDFANWNLLSGQLYKSSFNSMFVMFLCYCSVWACIFMRLRDWSVELARMYEPQILQSVIPKST